MFLDSKIYMEDLGSAASIELPWEQLRNKNILITGATGLIGSFLVDVLMFRNRVWNDNIAVYAVGRNIESARRRFESYFKQHNFFFLEQDISDPLVSSDHFDFIIHGASNAYPNVFSQDPVGTMKANLFGMYNLLAYAKEHDPSRVVYVSSGEIYGEGRGVESFREDYSGYVDCASPRACYPSSKRAAETLCVSFLRQYQTDVVIVRPCHTYGATAVASDNRVTAQFVNDILHDQDIVLKSEGLQVRSYCYVSDCVTALLTVMLRGESGQAYNIANRNSIISIREMAEMIADIGQKKAIFEAPDHIEKAGYSIVTRAVLESDKLESLGWKGQYGMRTGLERTIGILSENI